MTVDELVELLAGKQAEGLGGQTVSCVVIIGKTRRTLHPFTRAHPVIGTASGGPTVVIVCERGASTVLEAPDAP